MWYNRRDKLLEKIVFFGFNKLIRALFNITKQNKHLWKLSQTAVILKFVRTQKYKKVLEVLSMHVHVIAPCFKT